jgi:cytochrome P450
VLEHVPALGAPRPGKLGDLNDPAFLEDPYPTFRRLLTEGPVLRDDEHNLWLVAGHAEVLQALGHPAASVATAGARIGPALGEQAARFAPLVAAVSHFLTRLDPPDHTRLRALLGKAFTHEAVDRMHDTVAALVEECLGPRVGRGELDLMAELAVPLPLTVICRMLGIPTEDQPRIKRWSDDLASIADNDPKIDVLERAQQSLGEMREYILLIIEECRRRPGSDLLSALIAVEDAGDRLSPDELFGTVQVLLIAGQETTTNLLGNSVHALLANPEQLARLRQHPELMPSAVEECLRWDSPVQSRTRVTTADVEIGDQRIPTGQTLFLLLGAANRDPRAFPDPDRFDVGRAHNAHVALGHGIHYCLGNALARLEGRVALQWILDRLPRLALKAGVPARRRRNFSLRGFESLWITC